MISLPSNEQDDIGAAQPRTAPTENKYDMEQKDQRGNAPVLPFCMHVQYPPSTNSDDISRLKRLQREVFDELVGIKRRLTDVEQQGSTMHIHVQTTLSSHTQLHHHHYHIIINSQAENSHPFAVCKRRPSRWQQHRNNSVAARAAQKGMMCV